MKFLNQVAQTPPMGWNSFDCYGSAITEAEFRANVDVMAAELKPHGWEYAVVDFCWSHPSPGPCHNPHQGPGFSPILSTDRWGRLVPAVERFPSSAGGAGFKPLADYVHSKGLKFGIHVMRGIPRQVVHEDQPICGGKHRAREVANVESTCNWLNHMVGVRAADPAGQDYYDSLFELYASWEVDFVKVDDILADGNFDSEGPYHETEIEAVAKAIERCGRPMVLSLSPGDAPKSAAGHVVQFASMWRISADFWDDWRRLKRQFDLCHWWTPHRSPGRWPDADMLPIGRLSKRGPKGPDRNSWFTSDEQYTLLTLWCMFHSPLMMGGSLTDLDEPTRQLLTNPEVLAINQRGTGGAQLIREDDYVVWTARDSGGPARYVALFNLGDAPRSVRFEPAAQGLPAGRVRDLWRKSAESLVRGGIERQLPPHGCALFKLEA
jgi:alpha-galactosidase